MMKTQKLWPSLISTLLVFIIILMHRQVFVVGINDQTITFVIPRNSKSIPRNS